MSNSNQTVEVVLKLEGYLRKLMMKNVNYVLFIGIIALLIKAVQAETALAIPVNNSNHICILEWFPEQIKPYFLCFWPAIIIGFAITLRIIPSSHRHYIRNRKTLTRSKLAVIFTHFHHFFPEILVDTH